MSQIRQRPGLLDLLAQTLMVYQTNGSDFRATLHTDLPVLNLKWSAGLKAIGTRRQSP